MKAVILCAGKGSRMLNQSTNTHKSLLPISENQSFLSRILHQLVEYDFKEVIVITGYNSHLIRNEVKKFQLNIKLIHNNLFEKDTNIWSMKLAIESITSFNEPLLIIEADTYFSNLVFNSIVKHLKTNISTWFTKGLFVKAEFGGILEKDIDNNVTNIKIVKEYDDSLKNFFKLTGLMIIELKHIEPFLKLLKAYSKISLKQYYLKPWYENLNLLPSKSVDFTKNSIISCNTKDEYNSLKILLNKKTNIKIELVSRSNLFPIEGFIEERKNDLFDEIKINKRWIKPLVIEKNFNLILDGHHRFEVSKLLDLDLLPCIKVDYNDVELWSLRDELLVTREIVIKKALEGDIYPCKTVKHDFNFSILECDYKFSDLKI